jgi:hypothetical protein
MWIVADFIIADLLISHESAAMCEGFISTRNITRPTPIVHYLRPLYRRINANLCDRFNALLIRTIPKKYYHPKFQEPKVGDTSVDRDSQVCALLLKVVRNDVDNTVLV